MCEFGMLEFLRDEEYNRSNNIAFIFQNSLFYTLTYQTLGEGGFILYSVHEKYEIYLPSLSQSNHLYFLR